MGLGDCKVAKGGLQKLERLEIWPGGGKGISGTCKMRLPVGRTFVSVLKVWGGVGSLHFACVFGSLGGTFRPTNRSNHGSPAGGRDMGVGGRGGRQERWIFIPHSLVAPKGICMPASCLLS